jgi:hypothetical protein
MGKQIGGDHLLFLFALIMLAVGAAMLRPKAQGGDPDVRINPGIAIRLVGIGFIAVPYPAFSALAVAS